MRKSTLALLAVCIASPAVAFDIEYPQPLPERVTTRAPHQVRAWKHHAPTPKVVTRVIVAQPALPKVDPRCKPWVAAIGDSAKSEAAAKLESQKSWKGVVQFDLGNKFLDLNNAEDIEYQCGPSSVPKYGGLVESAASRFLPIESITCRLSARPCAAPVQRDTGK